MSWPVRLHHLALLHPRRVLAIAAIVMLLIAPGVARLTLRTDGHALVPTDAPEVVFDRAVREELGIEDPVVIFLRSNDPNGVFNPHTLGLVTELTAALKRLPGVRPGEVLSLATARGDRLVPGTLTFRTLLDPPPTTPKELATLRDDLTAIQLYTGTFVSFDGTMTSILVGVPGAKDRIALYRAIQDVIASRGPQPEEIHVIGAPVAEALLGHHLLEDLGVPEALAGCRIAPSTGGPIVPGSTVLDAVRSFVARHIGLLPVALAIMAIVFLASFRSLAAAALAMLKVGACLLLVFGLMGWCGVPVYLTIAVMPVMLIATGVSDEVHIFTHYAREIRAHPDKAPADALRTVMDNLWRPVAKTSMTTAIGFLAFGVSTLPAVRAFGVFTGVGTMLCMLWALTVTPACTVLLDTRRFVTSKELESGPHGGQVSLVSRGAAVVIRWRWGILAGAAAAVVASALGASRIEVQDSWIDGFAPTSEFYTSTRRFNEQFLGTHLLLVTIDGPEGALLQPDALRRIDELEKRIDARRDLAVGGTLGPAKYLSTTSYLVRGRRDGTRTLPPTSEDARLLWGFYKKIRGPERFQQIVGRDHARGVITVFLKDANFVATRRLMDDVREFERMTLKPAGLTVGFAGDVAVSQALVGGIVTTQVRSVALSILGILLVIALMTRSLKWGVYTVIPCSLAMLLGFGMMGWGGMALGVATSMFASMTVGIGDDYAIHLLDRWRLDRSAGRDVQEALVRTIAITGRPILIDAVSVSLGFGVLLLSPVPANARLGVCVIMSILGCMLGTITLLPAILMLRPPRISPRLGGESRAAEQLFERG